MSKLGVFGGAFDPVHNGHTALVKAVMKELKLAEMIVIPSYDSPLKGETPVTFADRFEMARLAFGDTDGVSVSDIEKKLGGKSYSINTIRALKEIRTEKDIYFIIGGDQLFTLTKWYRYEALLKECHVTAVTRPGISYTDMQEFANGIGRIKVLNLDIPDISSTVIRGMIGNGEDVHGLVPDSVLRYIETGGLYRD